MTRYRRLERDAFLRHDCPCGLTGSVVTKSVRWRTKHTPSEHLNRLFPCCIRWTLSHPSILHLCLRIVPTGQLCKTAPSTTLNIALPRGFTHHPPFSIRYCLQLAASQIHCEPCHELARSSRRPLSRQGFWSSQCLGQG